MRQVIAIIVFAAMTILQGCGNSSHNIEDCGVIIKEADAPFGYYPGGVEVENKYGETYSLLYSNVVKPYIGAEDVCVEYTSSNKIERIFEEGTE